ncbi:Alpha/beta hydrolase fold protein [Candidatus Magnetoovum chiemensis]|nr:Alpha/beta hydrolase fold protein [Candidatus Magnetoovum chiemensis]
MAIDNFSYNYIETNIGQKIAYLKSGRGKKKLLLIHGNLASSLWWKHTLESIPSGYEVYAPDLTGSGKTPETGHRHTIEYFLSFIHDFLRACEINEVYIAGHSMGGGIAQLFAIEHNDAVEALALVDSMPMDGFHVLYKYGIEKLTALMNDEKLLRKALFSVMPNIKDLDLFDHIVADAKRSSKQTFLEHPYTMHEANWSDKIGLIKCPTLILHGMDDTFALKEDCFRTAKAIKHCRLVFLENCGHSPMLETPREFNRLLFDFLDSV